MIGRNKERTNLITNEIRNLLLEENIKDKQTFLNYMSNIICAFDTDIAIEVMKNFGEEGEEEVMSIKVRYGY
jgi:hypothetical protein